MKFINRYWYDIGLVPALISIIYTLANWSSLDILTKVLLLNFSAILIHQFEEYGFPGGEPAIMNILLQKSDMPDRYPLNQFSAMLCNVLASYTFYLIPIFFPNIIWLGLAPAIFGIAQFIVHGIITNIKLKGFYNPGLGAVVFLHIPLGIYYIYYIVTNHLVTTTDWIFGVIYFIVFTAFIVNILTYKVFPNRNTKYIFSQKEMKRFHVKEKMSK